ncbi:MAG: hypothetical protein GEU80_17095 [Dehalococcoidia bacterium]|nr:hypothetical protein [Dehalococcoidia bacterium]
MNRTAGTRPRTIGRRLEAVEEVVGGRTRDRGRRADYLRYLRWRRWYAAAAREWPGVVRDYAADVAAVETAGDREALRRVYGALAQRIGMTAAEAAEHVEGAVQAVAEGMRRKR